MFRSFSSSSFLFVSLFFSFRLADARDGTARDVARPYLVAAGETCAPRVVHNRDRPVVTGFMPR